MAFKPTGIKLPPTVLYVASWGPDNWVTHGYEFDCNGETVIEDQPLVFQYGQQKVCYSDGVKTCYAYHIPPNGGGKHGVEYLTKNDGTEAKLWNVKSMVKAIVSVMSKRFGITEQPKFSLGVMSDMRNDAYATYTCGLTIAVHIARYDGEPEDYSPIWYSYADSRDKDVRCFHMDEKKDFIAACKERLTK